MRAEPLHSHKRRTDLKHGRDRREKPPPAPNKQQGKTPERRPRNPTQGAGKQATPQRLPEQAQRGAQQQRSESNSYTRRRGDGTTKAGEAGSAARGACAPKAQGRSAHAGKRAGRSARASEARSSASECLYITKEHALAYSSVLILLWCYKWTC